MRILILTFLLSAAVLADQSPLGAELFARHCVSCHGPDGQGNGPMADSLDPRPRDLTSRPFKHGCGFRPILHTITEGVPGTAMPPFRALSDPEREALADFVFQLSRKNGCGCRRR